MRMRTQFSALIAVAAVPFLAASCGDDIGESLVSACKQVECGQACASDSECPSGRYCANQKCTADCTPSGNQCKSNETCDARGRCRAGIIGSGGSSGSDDGGGSVGDGCVDEAVNFTKVIPTVAVLLDQSGSMDDPFPGAANRWAAAVTTLGTAGGVIASLENDVRFGLTLYTSNHGNAGGECPILKSVPVALGNFNAIAGLLNANGPGSDTPTAESIDAVAADLAPYPADGPKIIALATDGNPDTCVDPDAHDAASQALSVAAVQRAHAAGIETYYISVGPDVSLPHAQQMANAGKGLPPTGGQNAPFFRALSQQELIDAFTQIIGGVRGCVLRLNGQVDPADACRGQVTLDGSALGCNDPNGWKLNNPGEIELLGSACAAIKSGDHDVRIKFPCGIVTPPVK